MKVDEKELTVEQIKESYKQRILDELKNQGYSEEEIKKFKLAYKILEIVCTGTRNGGLPTITHPASVCYYTLKMLHTTNTKDIEIVIGSLLHDVYEDIKPEHWEKLKIEFSKEYDFEQKDCKEYFKDIFGVRVHNFITGVTKIKVKSSDVIKYIFYNNDNAVDDYGERNITNTNNLLRIIDNYPEVGIIKLDDRIHNISTSLSLPPHKQLENALETLLIYVPLAYYLATIVESKNLPVSRIRLNAIGDFLMYKSAKLLENNNIYSLEDLYNNVDYQLNPSLYSGVEFLFNLASYLDSKDRPIPFSYIDNSYLNLILNKEKIININDRKAYCKVRTLIHPNKSLSLIAA